MRICDRVIDEGRNSSISPRPAGHCDQRADRYAVALDCGLDGDHVAGIEAERLHHVESVGGVVVSERAGSQHLAGGRGLRALHRYLVQRLVQLGGERRLIGKERERKPKRSEACGCTISSGLPAVSMYFFRIQCFTCAPRLVKTIL